MTTDEMILALVERHGFVLPEGLELGEIYDPIDDCKEPCWRFGYGKKTRMAHSQAHDLCAGTFARQVTERDRPDGVEWTRHHLGYGVSAAAIEALYEALESQQPNAQAEQATEPQR